MSLIPRSQNGGELKAHHYAFLLLFILALLAGLDYESARDTCSIAKHDGRLIYPYGQCIRAEMLPPFEDR